jgi:hypothetical protein
VSYYPAKGQFAVRVNIGLQASASLAISLGPLRGAVGIYLGVFVDYRKTTGQSGALFIGIMLLVRGEVDVMGLVTVMLSLLLEIVYLSEGGGRSLIGRGTVSLEIRIAWCFKIKVRKSVSFQIGSARSSPRPDRGMGSLASTMVLRAEEDNHNHYKKAAEAYLQYFV